MAKRTVTDLFDEVWINENTDLCRIITYKKDEHVNPNIIQVRTYFKDLATAFNDNQQTTKFSFFQWCQDSQGTDTDPSDSRVLQADYWIFGFRLGNPSAPNKIAIICHVDTVSADESSTQWAPFDPVIENKDFEHGTQSPQDFLVGRGCIDDKGAAVSAFTVLRSLAETYDGSPAFENVQIEFILDTSEETAMSTPHYFEDPNTFVPSFGVVYDAQWVVRAEKGGERPVFTIPGMTDPTDELYISSLISSPDNSVNSIANWAEAVVKGPADLLQTFASTVQASYESYVFDDPDYQRAPLTVSSDATSVTMRTTVVGSQHGSMPEENRATGANPLVSLMNYMAGQVANGMIAENSLSIMCQFLTWLLGTRVFGELHTDLEEHDTVFLQGNGTSYAATRMTNDGNGGASLELDVRYAINHHSQGWDGTSEGFLPGKLSRFKVIFNNLVGQFNTEHGGSAKLSLDTTTIFAPDIRTPDSNEHFKVVEAAYKKVVGNYPERFAIPGGTDAKGYKFLLAVGPLFTTNIGPPINYHGIEEGAPVNDLRVSTKILYEVMSSELMEPPTAEHNKARRSMAMTLATIKKMRAKGFAHKCHH